MGNNSTRLFLCRDSSEEIDRFIEAAKLGDAATITYMLSQNPSLLDAKDQWDMSALLWARHPNVVRILIAAGANINIQNKKGCTLLAFAATHGLTEVVEILLNTNANINLQCHRGWSALHWAALGANRQAHEPVLRALLSGGANTAVQNMDGNDPLMVAVTFRCWISIKMLVEFGADINSVNKVTGFTPLMISAQLARTDVLRYLLDIGADVNTRGMFGNTALHLACEDKTSTAKAVLLFSRGADLLDKNSDGLSCLDMVPSVKKRDQLKSLWIRRHLKRYSSPMMSDLRERSGGGRDVWGHILNFF